MNRYKLASLLLLGVAALAQTTAMAQVVPETIVYNAKIVTVDDDGFTSSVGTIAEAMSIRDGKIVALGANAQIRGQAGPNTKQIDLKGRTVLPGLIVVHDHPYDWAPGNPYSLKKVLTDDMVLFRYVKGSPQEQAQAFPGVLREALSKAKPGQWVYMVFPLGDNYEYGIDRSQGRIFQLINRDTLNQMSPNNPVVLRDVFTGMMVNDRAYEEAKRIYPYPDLTSVQSGGTNAQGLEQGFRWMFHEIVMRDHYAQLKEIHRLELSWWSGYGVTAFASQAYTPSNVKVYNDLSRSGQMAMRNMWAWNWRENVLLGDDYVSNASVFMEGLGNDFFWYGGARAAQTVGGGCSSLTPRTGSTGANQNCAYDPGGQNYKMLYRYIKNGGRYAITHTTADRDIDYVLEIIEKASAEAGMSLDEIRAKRHTFDHLTMSPRPDQIPLVKKLGMVPGGSPFYFFENSPRVLEQYGEQAVEWVMPKKSLVDAGIRSGFEIDRPLATTDSLTVLWTLARMIDRKSPADGKVYAPNQRVSRELALKTATIWGAYYLMREDRLGSLKPGKLADFIVLDRDYLTVPESDIEKLRVLMTVGGGKTTHLVPSLARELGTAPAGAQVELGGPASRY
ncbi:MAG: hypothetical protein A3F68_05480 [Acidobacteria bacterium RIFCSPLOWO2_12_FULL_54_10]|nr:MAG: hypothetical protein A3F68_05480 [Acidobacteria bacterium RIFCSPLOWO2_12_FULL_54_10]